MDIFEKNNDTKEMTNKTPTCPSQRVWAKRPLTQKETSESSAPDCKKKERRKEYKQGEKKKKKYLTKFSKQRQSEEIKVEIERK